MSISSINSVSSLSQTSGVARVATTQDDARPKLDPSVRAGDRPELSKLGELFSQLQDLESTDPAKAKQVLSSIASTLTEKANSSDNNDPHLQELADKFTEAADTGDLSVLQPRGHHHRPEGPPPPAASDDGANDATSTAQSSGVPSTAASTTASGKIASYTRNHNNPFQQLESVISDALASARG